MYKYYLYFILSYVKINFDKTKTKKIIRKYKNSSIRNITYIKHF